MTKEPKTYCEEKKASSINDAGTTGKPHAKKETRCHLSPYSKINSKWIIGLNMRPEIINYTEENIATKLINLGLRGDFMNLTSKARKIKAKINEWDYIKLQSL